MKNFVSISSLTDKCAAQKINKISSSLWTCLHHMVILGRKNKITDFLMILAWACPFKKNQKIEKNSEVGRWFETPTRILFFFFGNVVFFLCSVCCCFLLYKFPKEMKKIG